MEKLCQQCGFTKDVSLFNRRKASKNGFQSRCRECSKSYYKDNKERHIERVKTNNQRYLAATFQRFLVYLKEHPCVDCGESDPVVLEFDHVRGQKLYRVSELVRSSRLSPKRLFDEIAKCEVRCANCHRRKTARDFGWRKILEQ